MIMRFTAAFTGQLSSLQGVSFPGANLRVEKGWRYTLEHDPETGHGTLKGLKPEESDGAQEAAGAAIA